MKKLGFFFSPTEKNHRSRLHERDVSFYTEKNKEKSQEKRKKKQPTIA